MREDAVGFFWEDLATARKRGEYARVIPPVPDNGWVAPKEFPRLTDAPVLVIDCETRDTGLITMGPGFRRTGEDGAEIVGLAVGTPEGGRWYFPMRHTIAPEQNMDPGAVLAWARDNICTPGQTKVGANLAYDVDALWSEGVPVTGPFVDVQYAEALLDENRRSYALDKLGLSYLGEGKTSTELRDWCVRAYGDEVYRANIWRAPPCLVGPYAEGDVDLPLRIYEHQKLLLEQQSLTQLFSLECSLLPQLVRMRQRGVKVDIAYAKILDDELSSSIDLAQARLDGVAGKPINVNSRDDLQRLFDKAGVEYPMTKPESGAPGVPSFAKEFLSHCSHPVAELITEIRKLTKYRDTFVRGYVLNLNVMGRLHALFHPLKGDENGTVSGRFSSSLPNLQNIPVRDPVWGPRLRALFIPEDGEVWGRHDWSQIEYRFLAHYARGPSGVLVRQRYNDDPTTDFHDMTQELIRVETGTTLDRKPVKNINFGLCIAEGQRVLTRRGLVPIESVEDCDLLWDGIEWVTHGGVLCNGIKKVIDYDGIKATPDHVVWTRQGRQVCLGVAASEGFRLERTGTVDGRTVASGDAPGHSWDVQARTQDTDFGSLLRRLWSYKASEPGQLQNIADVRLPEGQVSRPKGKESRYPVRRNDSALQSHVACERQELPWSWHQGLIQVARALYPLGFGEMAGREFQRSGLRPEGQRWSLLAKEPQAVYSLREPSKQTAKVYDIIDAGPRNRFTCEGVLVHNCYGMGKKKLTSDLGLDDEAGERLFEAYHTGVPFVKATYEAAQNQAATQGYIFTVLGRRARFPLWEPVYGNGKALPEDQAVTEYGRIRRAFTHKTLNRLLQGSAADLMKTAMAAIDEAGIEDTLGPMLLTCHDETGHSVPQTAAAREALDEVKHIMETCMVLRVPVIAEQSTGLNWGQCK